MEQHARGELFGIDAKLLFNLFHERQRIVRIKDGKGAHMAHGSCVHSQEPHGKRMERADIWLCRGTSPIHILSQARGATAHFLGRFIGKRYGKDIVGRYTLRDEVCHAVREHARLAGSRPREHQKRAVGCSHRFALFFIESLQKCLWSHAHG